MIYGGIVDIDSGNMVAPARKVKWKDYSSSFFDEKLLEMALNKTKDVVWMSSNCHSYSERDRFADTLGEHVGVANLGRCRKANENSERLWGQDLDKEVKKYLFYGAFENSLCKDYVTEKVYSNLNSDMVLIVYGGANYSDFLPPKSYIDANEYKTTKDLANYLKFLKKSPREYIKYFWWRKYYRQNKREYSVYCELCKKLNRLKEQGKSQEYENFNNWWDAPGICSTPKISIYS
jgi:alpha-1,3-fucosyltransferase